ncbi:MAG: hypothetical protein WBW53_12850 [Terriglobales bacterium]
MTSEQITSGQIWDLLGQGETPPSVVFCRMEMELWPYRERTVALLRRYARASVEVGKLPSLLGREFFRSRVTSYTLRSFEDIVIFVIDMERAIGKLSATNKDLLAMNIIEKYTVDEVARLHRWNPKTVRRLLPEALDELSRILLEVGLMKKLPYLTGCQGVCQEAISCSFGASYSKEWKNKSLKRVHNTPSNLIS